MVNEKEGLYECEECGLIYESEYWAKKCERFCRKNNACSIDITKHAKKQNGKSKES
ncbi:MAG: hypothetical protein ABEI74_04290 [Candidatus Pacearchaeota archaeon]